MLLFKKKTEPLGAELVSRILETVDALVVVLNPEGKIVTFNHKCQEVSGYKESEVKGRVMWDVLIPKPYISEAKSYFDELITGHFSAAHTNPWLTKDGKERLIQWQSTTIPDKSGKTSWVIATGIDVSEQSLERDEQRRLSLLTINNPSPVVQLDREGTVTFCNQAALQFMNRRRLQGENWRRVCPGVAELGFDRFLRSSSPQTLSLETRIGDRSVAFDHYLIPDRATVLVYGRDLTVERTGTNAIHEAETTARAFLENLPVAVLVLDARGTPLDCNPAFEKLLGYRRSDLAGRPLSKLKLVPQRQIAQLTRLPSGRGAVTEEFDLTRKDGRRISVLLSRAAIRGLDSESEETPTPKPKIQNSRGRRGGRDGRRTAREGPGDGPRTRGEGRRAGPEGRILVVIQDISDRKQSAEELSRCKEKLEDLTQTRAEALGEPGRTRDSGRRAPAPAETGETGSSILSRASGVANRLAGDLRVPLGVARNSIYFLATALEASPDERLRNHVRIMSSALEQTDQVIAHFDRRLRLPSPVRTLETIPSLIHEALGGVALRESTKVEQELPSDLPAIEVDRAQIVRLLGALIANAQQAMSRGGTLSLRARIENHDVVIGVIDTGSGISGEHRKRIFQPFFTTKPEGIGLGLLMARETVEANLGRIEFDSNPGRGTTFRIRFPAAGAKPADRPEKDEGGGMKDEGRNSEESKPEPRPDRTPLPVEPLAVRDEPGSPDAGRAPDSGGEAGAGTDGTLLQEGDELPVTGPTPETGTPAEKDGGVMMPYEERSSGEPRPEMTDRADVEPAGPCAKQLPEPADEEKNGKEVVQ